MFRKILLISLLFIGTVAMAQDKPSPVPQMSQLTINDLKLKIADLTIQTDKQAEYIQVLQSKILELQSQIDKLKSGK